jgi:protein-disulfide isomerase-like protein with CxxC motif
MSSYLDSTDCAVGRADSEDGTDVHVGQVWKDRRAKPSAVFLVLKVYERHYVDGKKPKRTRVIGALSMEHGLQPDRSLDLESLRTMFPVLMFEPKKPEVEEDK